MEVRIEFPDTELSKSDTLGEVFHMPKLDIPDDSSDSDTDDRRRGRPRIRPQSAKANGLIGPSLELPSRVLPSKPKGVRPWSAQPKTGQRKISRQPLRRPTFKPPPRSPTVSVSSETSTLITAVGLANNVKKGPDTPDSAASEDKHVKSGPSPASRDRWAITLSEVVQEGEEVEEETTVEEEPVKRSKKQHPTFESWVQGSPYDSDEYDTDLDIDEFIKTEIQSMKKKTIEKEQEEAKRLRRRTLRRRKKNKAQIKEEKPIDPTGRAMYSDQCKVQGLVPVSYVHRHLGNRNLRMRHHYLGGCGTKPIAVALVSNTITETVDIRDNYVEPEGARYVAGMLRNNTFITNLNISNNFIGSSGFEAICRMLETNTTLKTLCVSENKLTDRSAQSLIEGLKNNTSLTSLDLSGNDFCELGGIYIGGALSVNEGLMDLDVSWNAIRTKGAAAIISALNKNKTLEVLDLSWNGIGQSGADALKITLKGNATLKVLDISNNHLNTKCAETFAWGLARNLGLETLCMNLNPVRDAGVEAVLKAAEKHPNLKLLSIEEIGISPTNFRLIHTLETDKGMMVLHGGVGGYTRATTTNSMMKLFSRFVESRSVELETSCHQYDCDRNGLLGLDDLKMALKEGGLRLTNRQLNVVIDELNYTSSQVMNYRDILSGKMLEDYYRQKPSRSFNLKTQQITVNSLPDIMRRQLTVI